jgi:Rrf2 family protein
VDLSLTKRGQYVVRAAIALARAHGDGYLKTREIAATMNLPGQYAPQVLMLLGHAGLTESRAGSSGGHRLLRPPAQISLLEIIRAAEGEIGGSACMLNSGGLCGHGGKCVLHRPWLKAQKALLAALASTSLESLAGLEEV